MRVFVSSTYLQRFIMIYIGDRSLFNYSIKRFCSSYFFISALMHQITFIYLTYFWELRGWDFTSDEICFTIKHSAQPPFALSGVKYKILTSFRDCISRSWTRYHLFISCTSPSPLTIIIDCDIDLSFLSRCGESCSSIKLQYIIYIAWQLISWNFSSYEISLCV